MAAVPGLPPLSGLPLDKLIAMSGLQFHSSWLGGTTYQPYSNPFFRGFLSGRYGYGLDSWWIYLEDALQYGFDATYPDGRYVSGPHTAVDVTDLFREIRGGGWKFFSPNGLNGDFLHAEIPGDIDLTEDVVQSRYFTDAGFPTREGLPNEFYLDPFIQHVVLGQLTSTVMSGGRAPLWSLSTTEIASSSTAIARYAAWDTLLIVIDGTGSSSGGRIANGHLDALIPALISAGRSQVRLVVTKFSDYPEPAPYFEVTGPDETPALLLGTFNGIDSGTSDVITTLNETHDTGGGADTNESQFEGIHLAITTANARGWATGNLGIVVYTDAGSVVTFQRPYSQGQYLRMTQRNDGLGIARHPRLPVANTASSRQRTQAPRVGQRNIYS